MTRFLYPDQLKVICRVQAERARRKDARRKEVRGKRLQLPHLPPSSFQCLLSFLSVMLLGQAESGKSTLQKQFQLYYASQTLDHEKPSWRPVVYLNTIKAIRMILEEVEHAYQSTSDLPFENDVRDDTLDHGYGEIMQLRHKLLPLVVIEESLASQLSGGVSIGGGRRGTFVRAGWQALVTPDRTWPTSDIRNSTATLTAAVNLAAKTLAASCKDIELLWRHSFVKALLNLGRLRLDESAPL
jgi:hypothetical protein